MNKKSQNSFIKRILFELIAVFFVCFVFIMVAMVLIRSWLRKKIWYDTDWLWPFFHWAEGHKVELIVVIVLAGCLFITIFYLIRMIHYMTKVVEASRQMAKHTYEPLILPVALKEIQDELNMVSEHAKRNAELAAETEKRKNDLIMYLAHDLKTPLTSVIGYLSLLEEQPDLTQAQREKFTSVALVKAERLENLINEFFDITRFNLSTIVLEKQRVHLSRMLEQITYEFLPVMSEKSLVWDNKIEENIELLCDPDKISRVFDNLIRNAINYSYKQTALSLQMELVGNEVVICLSNHGHTIPKEKLEHIFEQFFRLDSSRTTATGGAGLGLAIAKQIVELHEGTITVESSDETICFTVHLPNAAHRTEMEKKS